MIDFSKISAKALPKKTVTVNICQVPHSVDIYPLTGSERVRYWGEDFGVNAGNSTLERVIIMLVHSAKLTPSEASQLVEADWNASVELAGLCHQFTDEYEKELRSMEEQAKKNLQTETSNNINS